MRHPCKHLTGSVCKTNQLGGLMHTTNLTGCLVVLCDTVLFYASRLRL